MTMQAFEIGNPLPFFFSPGYELCRASFNPTFFDLVYWVPPYDPQKIDLWQQAALQYGVYVCDHIPFFILDFPGKNWSMDISLNIYSMQEELLEAWLNNKDNMITMLLCDCYSNVLLDLRRINIDPISAAHIRETLEKQKHFYTNAFEVQKRIENIMDSMLTEDMLKKVTLHRLK